MSYYHWLGIEGEIKPKLVRLECGGPNYPDPPYHNVAYYDDGTVERRMREACEHVKSYFEAYGYEEPQAGTEANNLTDSDSKGGVREPLAVEADGFITVHPKLNRPLNR